MAQNLDQITQSMMKAVNGGFLPKQRIFFFNLKKARRKIDGETSQTIVHLDHLHQICPLKTTHNIEINNYFRLNPLTTKNLHPRIPTKRMQNPIMPLLIPPPLVTANGKTTTRNHQPDTYTHQRPHLCQHLHQPSSQFVSYFNATNIPKTTSSVIRRKKQLKKIHLTLIFLFCKLF